ncbi:MAG: hypothetical protein KDB88_06650, partial [Flavobacteriales bacterium]|nr:hypothetical protein [Flavobacteriales bacterium]
GAYGADLAYRTIHGDGQGAMKSLKAVESLSAQLEMTNAFDKALMERFKAHVDQEDSLLRLSGEAFQSADQYLKANDRNDLSALILAGGWIETLHLSVISATSSQDKGLMDRIGSQGRALKDLVSLLEEGDKDGSCAALCADLRDLGVVYQGIATTYTYEEPVTTVKDKTTYINSRSTVEIDMEQVAAISDRVAVMRNKHFN